MTNAAIQYHIQHDKEDLMEEIKDEIDGYCSGYREAVRGIICRRI